MTMIRFRTIEPKDRIQIQQLHEEWFPVEYQQDFYDDLCQHQRMCASGHALYTMVATVPKDSNNNKRNKQNLQHGHSDSSSDSQSSPPSSLKEEEDDTSDERIIACLVGCVLGAHKLNAKSQRLLVPAFSTITTTAQHRRRHHRHKLQQQHSKLFYIMTLGTVTEYRHLGLATQLVQQVVRNVVQNDRQLGTVYLHVITHNEAAIRFYEQKLGFWRVDEIPDYYSIDNEPHNCYLYAKYYHGTYVRSFVRFYCCSFSSFVCLPISPHHSSSM